MKRVKHHVHITGEYSNGSRVKHYEGGQYILHDVQSVIYNSRSTRRITICLCISRVDHYNFTFIMKLIASRNAAHRSEKSKMEIIPISEDKEMLILFNGIHFKTR